MAEDKISSYVDRAGVKGDTDFIVSALNEVYTGFKKIESVKIDLRGISGLAGLSPMLTQAKAGADSLATATDAVTKRIQQMNGSSKEFTQTLLTQTKAQKEAALAALAEAKAANEVAKSKTAEAKASEQSAKAKADEKKLTDQVTNDYLQLSKAYNDAALKAKNYFLTLGEAHPITVQAIKDASDIGNTLKRADASVGQFQRNVGNYKSAFDGLGFSFAQVGRELPSLAINLQTFALAISNNLPIVADELKKASDEIKRLKAEGKDTPSLFQRMKGAIFSFQTGLSLAITALVLFSGKMFGAADASKELKERTDDLVESLKDQIQATEDINELIERQGRIDTERLREQGAGDEAIFKNQLRVKKEQLNNLRIAEQEANRALETEIQKAQERRDVLGQFGSVKATKKEIAALKERYTKVNKEIEAAEKARIAKEDEIEEFQAKRAADLAEKGREDAEKRKQDALKAAKDAKEAADAELQFQFEIKALELQRTIDFNKEIADDENESEIKRLTALRKYYEASQQLIDENALLQVQLGEKTATELELIAMQQGDAQLRLEREFQRQRLVIRQQANARIEADEKRVRDALEKGIDEAYKRFEDDQKRRAKDLKDYQEYRKKLAEEEAEHRIELEQSLVREITELSFTLFTSGLDREKNAIRDQIDLLEQKKQKDIEVANQTILNVQDRAAAITVIEARAQAQREQLQQRARELDYRKAQFDKAASVARIIQETAVAVVQNLKFPALIPLVIAIGAAQLAAVIATPIPRYRHGKNLHDSYEGPAVVGDGGKKEAIIREDGSVHITDDKPQLTYVKKRDVILPDANQLASFVISGNMGGRLREQRTLKDDGLAVEIKSMKKDVVKAIKSIPQPIIRAEGIISRRIRRGDSSNNYLNQNLQS